MTYFVFIESDAFTVPHMEPLLATDSEDAMAEARDLMGLHFSAIAAHVFKGDDRIGTITPNEMTRLSAASPRGHQPERS